MFYKGTFNIGGKSRLVVAISDKPAKKEVNGLHHVLLLDRSNSMSNNMDALIEDVKKAIDQTQNNDVISVIWFSGPDECQVLLQGAKKDPQVNKLLDTIKSTVGSTCFSVPLQKTNEVVDVLKPLCENVVVTLFTDGHPVTPWTEEQEKQRIFDVLHTLRSKVIAVNTIGYGNYYNRDLLVAIANTSDFGMYTHSQNVNDYSKIFSDNLERMQELALGSLEVTAPGADVVYLSHKNVMLRRNELAVGYMSKYKNQIFIIAPDDQDFTFEYNGTTYSSSDIKNRKMLDATVRNMLYAYAYGLYYNGRREESLAILVKDLGDKYFVDNQLHAFTYDEVAAYSTQLRRAVFHNKKRYMDGVCQEDYLPADDAVCVMDVLKLLANDHNQYIPAKEYNRIGRKTIDAFDLLEPLDENVQIRSPFKDLVFNKEHMNLSVRYSRPRVLRINPRAAARVGLPERMDVVDFRTQTIVKDGNLNMKSIEVLVDQNTQKQLERMKVPFEVKGQEGSYIHMVIHLTLPIINRQYSKASIDDVLHLVKRITALEAEQKVLNHMLKDLKAKVPFVEGKFKQFTPEQLQVLEEHGVNKDLVYQGVKREVLPAEDYYITRTLVFQLKGYASLPKVDEVLTKMLQNKKLTPVQQLMANCITRLQKELADRRIDIASPAAGELLRQRLNQVKINLFKLRAELNAIKMGKILTGSWWEELKINDSKQQYEYTGQDGFTLVVKTERTIVAV